MLGIARESQIWRLRDRYYDLKCQTERVENNLERKATHASVVELRIITGLLLDHLGLEAVRIEQHTELVPKETADPE